jgi:uncharacterized damage-inducible protein DinB
MFHHISDFLRIWQMETLSTARVFEHLTDPSLSQAVSPGGRTLGRLANHIVETLTEMPAKLHLGIDEEHPDFDNVHDLIKGFHKANDAFVHAIRTKWNDETLRDETELYGDKWKNSFALWVLVAHMIHHRSQMTVLMRQAGIKVPGTYGPAKEEWADMGLEPMQ